jgi:hypothetical protein
METLLKKAEFLSLYTVEYIVFFVYEHPFLLLLLFFKPMLEKNINLKSYNNFKEVVLHPNFSVDEFWEKVANLEQKAVRNYTTLFDTAKCISVRETLIDNIDKFKNPTTGETDLWIKSTLKTLNNVTN